MVITVNAETAKFLKQVVLTDEQVGELKGLTSAQRYAGKKVYRESAGKEPALKLEEKVGCNVQISDTVSLQSPAGQIIAVFTVEDKWLEGTEKSPVYFGGKLTFI
jgi:hypothetical protein